MAAQVREVRDLGVQVVIVVGGGNIFRGLSGSKRGIERATGDYMGMLATIINGLALQDALEKIGVPTRVQSAISMAQVAEPFIIRSSKLESIFWKRIRRRSSLASISSCARDAAVVNRTRKPSLF